VKRLIKPPHAAKAARQRDLIHGETCLTDKLPGQQYTAGLRDRDGGSPYVVTKEAAKLTLPNLKPISQ
jgi:hypothetical protein